MPSALWTTQQLTVRVRHDGRWEEHALQQPYAIVGGHPRCHVPLPIESPQKSFLIHVSNHGAYGVPLRSRSIGEGWLPLEETFAAHGVELQLIWNGPQPPQLWPNSRQPLGIEFFHHHRSKGEYQATGPLCVIGRRRPSHCRMKHDRISSTHCAVYAEDDRAWVIDLFSSNGTKVDDHRVSLVEIGMGQRVYLDDHISFERVECDPPEPHAATPLQAHSPNSVGGDIDLESAGSGLGLATLEDQPASDDWADDRDNGHGEELETQVQELNASVAQLSRDLTHSEAAAEQAEQTCVQLETQRDEMQAQLAEAVAKAEQFQQQAEEAERNRQQEVERREADAREAAQRDQEQGAEGATDAERQQWQLQLSDIRDRCEHWKSLAETQRQALDKMGERVETAESNQVDLQQKLTAAHAKLDELKQNAKAAERLAEQQEAELQAAKAEQANMESQLQEQLAAAQETYAATKRELEETRSEHSKDAADLTRLRVTEKTWEQDRRELQRLTAEVALRQRDVDDLQSKLELTNEELRAANEQLVNAGDELQSLTAERQTLAERCQQLEDARGEWERDSKKLQEQLVAREGQLRNELERLAEESAEIANQRETLASRCETLEAEQSSWSVERQQLVEAAADEARLRGDLEQLQAEAEEIARQRDALEARVSTLESERSAWATERQQLVDAAADEAHLRSELEQLQAEAEEFARQRETLVSRCAAFESERKRLAEVAEESQRRREELERAAAQHQAEQQELTAIKADWETLAAEKSAWESERKQLEDEALSAMQAQEDLQRELSGSADERDQLRQRLDENAATQDELREELTQTQAEVAKLRDERDALAAGQAEADQQLETMERLTVAESLQHEELQALRDALDNARERIAEYDTLVARLHAEQDDQQQAAEALQEELEALRADAMKHQHASNAADTATADLDSLDPTIVLQHELDSSQMLADALASANEELRVEASSLRAHIQELESRLDGIAAEHSQELKLKDMQLHETRQHLELFRVDLELSLERKDGEIAELEQRLADQQRAAAPQSQPLPGLAVEQDEAGAGKEDSASDKSEGAAALFEFDESLPIDPAVDAPATASEPDVARNPPRPRRPRRTISPIGVILMLIISLGAGLILKYVLNL